LELLGSRRSVGDGVLPRGGVGASETPAAHGTRDCPLVGQVGRLRKSFTAISSVTEDRLRPSASLSPVTADRLSHLWWGPDPVGSGPPPSSQSISLAPGVYRRQQKVTGSRYLPKEGTASTSHTHARRAQSAAAAWESLAVRFFKISFIKRGGDIGSSIIRTPVAR